MIRSFAALGVLCATLAACSIDSTELDAPPTAVATLAGSCLTTDGGDFCGGKSDQQCWCDELCTHYGDCCADREPVCVAPPPDTFPENCAIAPYPIQIVDVGGYDDLQTAVASAPPGATIQVCPGTYGPISIERDVNIVGAGIGETVFETPGQTAIHSEHVNLSLTDLSIRASRFAMVFDTSNLVPGVSVTLRRLEVADNEHGVQLSGHGTAKALVEDALFANTTAGRGLYFNGVTKSYKSHELTVRGTVFTGSHTPLQADYLEAVTIEDSTFLGDPAAVPQRQAVAMKHSTAEIVRTRFADRDATSGSAGAVLTNSHVTFRDCVFENNRATDDDETSTAVSMLGFGQLTLERVTMADNAGAPAIYLAPDTEMTSSELFVTGHTGAHVVRAVGTFDIQDSRFELNQDVIAAGHANGEVSIIRRSVFRHNRRVLDATLTGQTSGSLYINDSTIEDNQPTSGAAINLVGASGLQIQGSAVRRNGGPDATGAVSMQGTNSYSFPTMRLIDVDFGAGQDQDNAPTDLYCAASGKTSAIGWLGADTTLFCQYEWPAICVCE